MGTFPEGAHRRGGQAAAPVNRQLADEFARPLLPLVTELRRRGLSLRQIARELDRSGYRPRLAYPGQRWSAQAVRRLLARTRGTPTFTNLCHSPPAAAAVTEPVRSCSPVADGPAVATDTPPTPAEVLLAAAIAAGVVLTVEAGQVAADDTPEARALLAGLPADVEAALVELLRRPAT